MNIRESKQFFVTLGMFLFTVIGTYNAVVINSESHISGDEIKFEKRLDEMYGIVRPGRTVAASTSWRKLNKETLQPEPIKQEVRLTSAALSKSTVTQDEQTEIAQETVVTAAIQEELEMSLVEVINPKKWQNGLGPGTYSGSVTTRGGTIEALQVNLPNGEGLSVSYAEMSGNVFGYELDGENYSGMMYQADQNVYVITLTNGPLEGTRLRFSGAPSDIASTEVAASDDQYGNYYDERQAQEVAYDRPELEAAELSDEAQNNYPAEEMAQYDNNQQTSGHFEASDAGNFGDYPDL